MRAREELARQALRLARNILPKAFPLNRLQAVIEVLEETSYDNRNFRKKMLADEVVEETGKRETNVSHRPAKLYRFR